MKKVITGVVIIAFIFAMIKTASLMQSLGFALTLLIVLCVMCCFVSVVYVVFEGVSAVRNRDAWQATKSFSLAILVFIIAIKILVWLMKTLN